MNKEGASQLPSRMADHTSDDAAIARLLVRVEGVGGLAGLAPRPGLETGLATAWQAIQRAAQPIFQLVPPQRRTAVAAAAAAIAAAAAPARPLSEPWPSGC